MRWKIASLLFRSTSYLFGGSCFLCRGAARELLCGACDADLPRLSRPLCPRCALESLRGELCGRCLSRAPAYDATQAALAYQFPADALVQALKFRGELALAPLLAALLTERLRSERADLVVPVPLSTERLRRRGYIQAVEIARHLAGGRLEVTLCERTRDAPPQMELPYEARQRNVRGAFRCTRPLGGATVAVVDDVMTTGATLDEMARTLKGAGAERVVNWVVARTMPHD
ncbi:MAG TPA: ComF family protein [Burkholderiales bacterium]|nr:ComF family protein [Burkholderiales bacterium]